MRDNDTLLLEGIYDNLIVEQWNDAGLIPAVVFNGVVHRTRFPDGGHMDIWLDIIGDEYPNLNEKQLMKLVMKKFYQKQGREGFYDTKKKKFLSRDEAMREFKNRYHQKRSVDYDKLHSGNLVDNPI